MKKRTQQPYNAETFGKNPRAFLWFVAKEKIGFGVLAMMCVIIATLLEVSISPLMGKIVDTFNANDYDHIYTLAWMLIGVIVCTNIIFRCSGFLASWWITHLEKNAAQISFDYLIKHSAQFFANKLSGKLQNHVFNVSKATESTFPIILWHFLSLSVRLIASFVLAYIAHPIMGLIFVLFITISLGYNLLMSKKISFYAQERFNKASEAKGIVVDVINNILAVKQNNATTAESHHVHTSLDDHRKAHLKLWRFFDIVLFFGNAIIATIFTTFIFMAIHYWHIGAISVGQVVMLFTILMSLIYSLQFLGDSFSRLMENYGQLKEGLEQIFVPIDITDAKDAQPVTITKGEIQFHSVDFAYQDDDTQAVFHNLSLTIPAGQKIGLVGESGSGKTTFAGLILRFMDIQSGSITIDNHNITKIPQDDLRKSIAYVPQEALLFHRTLEQNIAYGKTQINEKELLQSAKDAHALEFINTFPKKFKTIVGERGIKLSGGQKQRVMIARAMLKKTPILILDEATSALDSHSEKLIQQALENLMKNRTTLVIAHRLSTLKKMNRIIVFDNGKIVEDGTHDELLSKKGKYWQLWEYQTGGRI